MKKMLTLLVAVALSASAASAQSATASPQSAQHAKAEKTPEQRAEKVAQHLTKSLGLSADQTARIQQITLTAEQERQAIRTKYSAGSNRKAAGPELKALKERTEDQLKQALTAEQYAKYTQLREERKEKHQGGQAEKVKVKAKS